MTSGARALTDDRLRRLAVVACVVALTATVAAVLLHLATARRADVTPVYLGNVVMSSAWPLAGLVVLRGRPRHRVGWLLMATGLLSVYMLFSEYALWSVRVAAEPLPLTDLAAWVSMFGFGVYFFVLPLLPLLVPDGRLPGRRWRHLVRLVLVAGTAATVARMVVPSRSDTDPSILNPVGVEALEPLNWVVLAGSYLCIVVATPAAVVALVLRTRRAVGVERARLQWFMLGSVALAVAIVVSQLLPGGRAADAVFALGLLGPPVGVVVAMQRHRLVDVELALSRTLVLVGVAAVVGGVGTALLLVLDSTTASGPGSLLVAGLVVLALAVRASLQRWIDRSWYPHRHGAALLGGRLVEAVSLAAEPREALAELVTAVRSSLRLPYVGFVGEMRVADGVRPDEVMTLDAVAMGRRVGELEVVPRREGQGFGRQERRVLDEVAAQAAMLAWSAGLVADVAANRESIVRAREEERRRLRHDLHDGVGPSLAGIALQADALAGRLAGTPEAQQAAAIRDRLRESVAQVRAVSHGLRPPVLDQLGLSAALRQLVAGFPGLQTATRVDELDGLPAASEVAAYAIASEAVANAARHSAASVLRVEAERSDTVLTLRVLDNGIGMPARPRHGVGLPSMRRRAAEVGGRVEMGPAPGGGTVVALVLPLEPPTLAPRRQP